MERELINTFGRRGVLGNTIGMTDDRPRPLSRLPRERLAQAELTAQCKRTRAAATERRILREADSAKRRARALALRRGGATYAAIGAELGVCLERARQIARKADRLANAPHWYDPLPMRARNFLVINGLAGLPEVEAAQAITRLTRRELLAFPNFGIGALNALEDWLGDHGLQFEEKPTGGSDPASGRISDAVGGQA
jgi:hypothetical protein